MGDEFKHIIDKGSEHYFYADFCGYTETEFWSIVDKLYNTELFEKNDYDKWVLKHLVWE